MADFSFPWTSTSADRQISSAQQRALYARILSNGVMKAFTGTVTGTTLNMTAGSAIVNGAFYDVGTGAAVELPASGSAATVVVRYDETARSNTLVAITTEPVNAGGVLDLPIATLTKSGSIWSAPTFAWTWCEPLGTSRRAAELKVVSDLLHARTDDTGWLTTAIAKIGDWQVGSPNLLRKIGKHVQFEIAFTLPGSSYSSDADGLISPSTSGLTVAAISDAANKPSQATPVLLTPMNTTATYAGGVVGSGWIGTNGVLSITALAHPSTTIAAGTWLVASGSFFVG